MAHFTLQELVQSHTVDKLKKPLFSHRMRKTIDKAGD